MGILAQALDNRHLHEAIQLGSNTVECFERTICSHLSLSTPKCWQLDDLPEADDVSSALTRHEF